MFPVIVVESIFSLLPLGRYLLPLTSWIRYLSRYSSKMFIFMWSIPSNHSNFVLCHDSLNAVIVIASPINAMLTAKRLAGVTLEGISGSTKRTYVLQFFLKNVLIFASSFRGSLVITLGCS